MHSSSFDIESGIGGKDGCDVLVAIAALVTEGRIPGTSGTKGRGFHEGPHCIVTAKNPPTAASTHYCDPADDLCRKYENVKKEVLNLWKKGIPLCVEVSLTNLCSCIQNVDDEANAQNYDYDELLLEQWHFTITQSRSPEASMAFNINQLIGAVRSQLYFSQISAWLSSQNESRPNISKCNLKYRLTIPGETLEQSKFNMTAIQHDFPLTDLGNNLFLNVCLLSLPRLSDQPKISCSKYETKSKQQQKMEEIKMPEEKVGVVDDRMHTKCKVKGKHRCEDLDELEPMTVQRAKAFGYKKKESSSSYSEPSTSKIYFGKTGQCRLEQSNTENCYRVAAYNNDLSSQQQQHEESGGILLNAILRSCRFPHQDRSTKSTESVAKCDVKCVQRLGEMGSSLLSSCAKALQSVSDTNNSDKNTKSDIFNNKDKANIYLSSDCDNRPVQPTNHLSRKNCPKLIIDAVQKADEGKCNIPTQTEQLTFRKNLDSAASMVFHSRTGLPLTSSPAPVRRGKSCFDFDSSINSVSAIKSALFSASFSNDDDSESDGCIISPCSPDTEIDLKKQPSPVKIFRRKGQTSCLLGTFEESVINGRLEPVSTVHGFRADLGASGAFVPRHLHVPVTVFFYSLGETASPYLGHMDLGRKGYNIPKSGTVQVTLFNQMGTVVKMFVILYNFNDMPPNSQTFIRQRTYYAPTNLNEKEFTKQAKWLRFVIHLRFTSSKSGRIYLHSDIRMIIFQKSDLDTATAHRVNPPHHELRSVTQLPNNPKYSPLK